MNENNKKPKLTDDGEINKILQMDLTADNFAMLLKVGLIRYGFGFLNVNEKNIIPILRKRLGIIESTTKQSESLS